MKELAIGLISSSSGAFVAWFAYRAKTKEVKVSNTAVVYEGYNKLVEDIQEDNARLRAENERLKKRNGQVKRAGDQPYSN